MHLASIPHQIWGGYPWLCCSRLSRKTYAQFRKSECGSHPSHEHLPPIDEEVCGSKSQHSCPLGGTILRPLLNYSLGRPHGTTPVVHNANRLINISFTGLVSFFHFLVLLSGIISQTSFLHQVLCSSVFREPNHHLDGCSDLQVSRMLFPLPLIVFI